MILLLEPLYSERKTLTCQFLRTVINALNFFQIVVAQQVMVCLQKSFENNIFFLCVADSFFILTFMLLGYLIVADKLLINLAVKCEKHVPTQRVLTFQLYLTVVLESLLIIIPKFCLVECVNMLLIFRLP